MTEGEVKLLALLFGGVAGWLVRLEHRLTKSESAAESAKENTEYLRDRFDSIFGSAPMGKK